MSRSLKEEIDPGTWILRNLDHWQLDRLKASEVRDCMVREGELISLRRGEGLPSLQPESLIVCQSKEKDVKSYIHKRKKFSQTAGLEPARGDPNWFLVNRLNRSATIACARDPKSRYYVHHHHTEFTSRGVSQKESENNKNANKRKNRSTYFDKIQWSVRSAGK